MAASLLIVGLGNPGHEYAMTRHNIGFWALDHLAGTYRIQVGSVRHHALVGSGSIRGWKVVLAKPETFMNLSGKSVKALLAAEGLGPEGLLVLHDEMDVLLGKVKLNTTGGDAGHNGIASIIEALGTREFRRLRIGIGKPPRNFEGADWVLSPFEADERPLAEEAAAEAAGRAAEIAASQK